MSLEKNYNKLDYTPILTFTNKPDCTLDFAAGQEVVPQKSWLIRAVRSVRKGINNAINKVIFGSKIIRENPGRVAAAVLVASSPFIKGCVFDTSGIGGAPDAHVQSDRPLDDGSFDAGDSGPDPDGGDGGPNPDGGDGSTTPDGGDGSTTPDAGPDAQVDPERCDDGIDNNGDGLTDCEDVATCNGMPSATPGTVCGPDGQKHENICNDGLSNDGDALIDCVDPDCDGKSCGNGCVCGGGIKTEDASACGNGIDDDGDGLTDCMDSNCTGEPCGTECECGGDGLKHQTNCDLGADGDGDGWEGCIDLDCQFDTRCTAFTFSCSGIPTGFVCNLGGGNTGFCSEYDICVDG